jgi:hypothetical protein
VDPASQLQQHMPGTSWRSDTLLLAVLNALAYLALYGSAGWQIPHFGTHVSWIGAAISLVPAFRELRTTRLKGPAMIGVMISLGVWLHASLAPCTGPCK